jgi:hypothetical protein
MKSGNAGMGMAKHRKSGRATKSPKFRHQMKMAAEAQERKDKSRIREPKSSITELFK